MSLEIKLKLSNSSKLSKYSNADRESIIWLSTVFKCLLATRVGNVKCLSRLIAVSYHDFSRTFPGIGCYRAFFVWNTFGH